MNNAKFLKKIQFWLFIFFSSYFSLIPHPPGILERGSDKIIHAIGYCLLLISCDVAYRSGKKLPGKVAFIFTFSLAMEVLQYFIPNRNFSFLDLLANLTGLSVGYLILRLLGDRFREQHVTNNVNQDVT
jgi:VanZ family protein